MAANTAKSESTEDLLSGFFAEIQDSTVGPAAPPLCDTTKSGTTSKADSSVEEGEDDLLNSFFSEVVKPKAEPVAVETAADGMDSLFHEKYLVQDLGTSAELVERLATGHYQWFNLNPYRVLMLDIDATDEDIKNRYKKLSTKVHPDKLRDMENAREAFEEVKKAYQLLMDMEQRTKFIANIELVREELQKERKRLIGKGVSN